MSTMSIPVYSSPHVRAHNLTIARRPKMASRSTWQTSIAVSAGIDSSGQSVKVIKETSRL
ncbi:hypothetical protein SAMN05216237_6676 [Pseudomonas yamanorum]|nr:hypothetical protein SAMN05216237_6676 [Pseudomonas yamanorum]